MEYRILMWLTSDISTLSAMEKDATNRSSSRIRSDSCAISVDLPQPRCPVKISFPESLVARKQFQIARCLNKLSVAIAIHY